MIAGLCHQKIIAPFIFQGTCHSTLFEAYIKNIFIKELKKGQVVILDDINFHKRKAIEKLIKSVGVDVLFLPAYPCRCKPNHNRKLT